VGPFVCGKPSSASKRNLGTVRNPHPSEGRDGGRGVKGSNFVKFQRREVGK